VRAPEPDVLQGHGVRLEPAAEHHLSDLLEAAQDDAIWPFLSVRRPRSVDEVRASLVRRPGELAYVVVVDERAVGSTSYLDVDLAVGGLEVGSTWYARPLWATLVNPACKLLLLGHAFDDLGAARVTLKTDARNLRSQAAIRKLGCSYDGTLRHHKLRNDGSVRDTAYFSLLAAEWPAARDGLLARLG
jgi:RimJ/RimL family protein N-acetyltransferase